MKPGWIEALATQIPDWMQLSQTPGAAVSILQAGREPEHLCFGVTSTEGGQAITPQTVFQAASLSKQVFAYMALKQCEQDVLDLDAPLSDYLPEPLLPGEPRLSLITTRRVLSHTTGLPNWRSDEKPLALNFTPGERFGYSGEGYVYLQRVIEHLTGQPLDDFMQDDWFQALRMPESSFVWREANEPRMAHAHKEGKPHSEHHFIKALSAASLYTTPADYARFMHQVLFPPQADAYHLSPEWSQAMFTPQIEAGPEVGWGLGWGLASVQGKQLAFQWGDNTGYKNIIVLSPEAGVGTLVMTNNEQGFQIWKNVLAESLDPQGLIFAWLENR